jgi:archaemetzincin
LFTSQKYIQKIDHPHLPSLAYCLSCQGTQKLEENFPFHLPLMSRNSSSSRPPVICNHDLLNLISSTHAAEVGFRTPTPQQQESAIGKRKRIIDDRTCHASFPAPLVLPGDELSLDPQCPGQTLDDWRREDDRNEVTREKNVIYIAAPPDVSSDVEFLRSWVTPQLEDGESKKKSSTNLGGGSSTSDAPPSEPVRVEDILEYVAAFYHGIPVKMLPSGSLCFTSWGDRKPKHPSAKASRTAAPRFIGLNTATECIRIRTRASLDGVFPRQLNLDDLLDATMSILPHDAYALLLLIQHDLFEDEDDEFVCGRAYGGSRVAVISMARYNPSLDTQLNVERQHAWPASHCASYMQACCEAASSSKPKAKTRSKRVETPSETSKSKTSSPFLSSTRPSALQAAVSAYTALTRSQPPPSSRMMPGLWLSRVCRTASHELGHCFGIEHCVYHACAMQGSASLREDVRQPPYLCPVDLAKVLEATGVKVGSNRRKMNRSAEGDREDDVINLEQPYQRAQRQRQRYEALLEVCNGHPGTGMFAAFGAWIHERLREEGERSGL